MRLMAIFAAGVLWHLWSRMNVWWGGFAVPADGEAGVVQTDASAMFRCSRRYSVGSLRVWIAESFKPSEIAQPGTDTYECSSFEIRDFKDLKEQDGEEEYFHVHRQRWGWQCEAVTYATQPVENSDRAEKDAEVDKMGNRIWRSQQPSRVGGAGFEQDEESQKRSGYDLDAWKRTGQSVTANNMGHCYSAQTRMMVTQAKWCGGIEVILQKWTLFCRCLHWMQLQG